MRIAITILLALVLCSASLANVADLSIENERVDGDVFQFEISIQRGDAWSGDGLGHADFYFDYNANGLGTDVTAGNLHPAVDGNSAYTLTAEINGGLLHLKIDFQNGGGVPWLPALNLAENICTVEMNIIDASEMSELQWDVINTGVLGTDMASIQETFQGSGDISLPVELTSFEGRYVNGIVELFWRTESEFQNWGFFVYKSDQADGVYERVNATIIKGAGSSTMPHLYTFVDERVAENSIYYYLLEHVDVNGHAERTAPIRVQTDGTPVSVLEQYSLEQNYPNPFNPQTTISFSLAQAEQVEIAVYFINGRLVRTIVNDTFPAGQHAVVWDGLDQAGLKAPSGSYLYQMRTRNFQQSKKLMLLR